MGIDVHVIPEMNSALVDRAGAGPTAPVMSGPTPARSLSFAGTACLSTAPYARAIGLPLVDDWNAVPRLLEDCDSFRLRGELVEAQHVGAGTFEPSGLL